MVYYTHGTDRMRHTAVRNQRVQEQIGRPETDRLTVALVGLAFFLTAAIAALAADLWLWPAKASAVPQFPTPELFPTVAFASLPAEPTSTPAPRPTPASYPAAVRIRIPAIGVDRSIVEVPLVYDAQTGAWERDYEQLFRQGRLDLVGHVDDSAAPGQPGNMVLVGHNYGYGVNGVFLRLGKLVAGQTVEIVNAAGQILRYRVVTVTQIPWTTRNQQQIVAHQAYLAVDGAERLTLVTCGGSSWAPFPDRVYVVAHPAQ